MLDEQIDFVAHRLTRATPPAHLRARVVARIESPHGDRRARTVMIVRVAAAGVIAALLVARFVTNWSGPDRHPQVVTQSSRPAAPVQTPAAIPAPPIVQDARGIGTALAAANPLVRPAQTSRDDSRLPLPDGAALENIQVATLTPEPFVEVDEMTTGSLEIEDLKIGPLEDTPIGAQ